MKARVNIPVFCMLFLTHQSWPQCAPPSKAQMDAAEQYSLSKGGQTFVVVYDGTVNWWLKRPVPDSVGKSVDQNNSSQYTLQIKPIINDKNVPEDFVMCRGAYGQCLYVMPSLKLVVVRNAPQSNDSHSVPIATRQELLIEDL